MLFKGFSNGRVEMGTGLKNLIETTREANAEQRKQNTPITKEQPRKKKVFDFYQVLPDIERIMPNDLPESKSSEPTKKIVIIYKRRRLANK